MELSAGKKDVTLGLAELDETTRLALIRLAAPEDEAARSAHIGLIMQAASDLSSSLRSYARCGLVNGRGSHGTGDLGLEAAGVFTALQRFAGLVRTPVIGERAVRDASAASASPRAWRRAL
jgi:hypothetical protein